MTRRSVFAALSAILAAKPAAKVVENHFEFTVSALDTGEMSRFIRRRIMPEINAQLRSTSMQHEWAELKRVIDDYNTLVKYGVDPDVAMSMIKEATGIQMVDLTH